jgi:WD40 repeat protein
VSLVDHRNTYQGSLLASQPLVDVQFGQTNYVFGVSNDVVYQWDIRTWKLVESRRDCLGNTKLWTHNDTVAIGSKLGIVRLGTISQGLKEYAEISNLVTHVTSLEGNSNGNLLVECSKWKANAIRLIDTSKGRCISGFPTVSTKVGLPTAASFSIQNQLCLGNSHGYLTFFDIKNV